MASLTIGHQPEPGKSKVELERLKNELQNLVVWANHQQELELKSKFCSLMQEKQDALLPKANELHRELETMASTMESMIREHDTRSSNRNKAMSLPDTTRTEEENINFEILMAQEFVGIKTLEGKTKALRKVYDAKHAEFSEVNEMLEAHQTIAIELNARIPELIRIIEETVKPVHIHLYDEKDLHFKYLDGEVQRLQQQLQKVQLRNKELAGDLESKNLKILRMDSESQTKDILFNELEAKVISLEAAASEKERKLEVKNDDNTALQRDLRMRDNKIIQLIKKSESLEQEAEVKDRKTIQCIEESEKLRKDVRFKDQRITQLLDDSQRLEQSPEKCRLAAARNVNEAVEKAKADQAELFRPMQIVGINFRSRVLGNNKDPDRTFDIGEYWHHEGLALADAWMYQTSCPSQRKDPGQYKDWYGFDPNFVWKNRGCKKLLEILDWQGALSSILAQDPDEYVERRQWTFEGVFKRRLMTPPGPSAWDVHTLDLLLSQDNEALHKKMKKEYSRTLQFLKKYDY
jgi:hypothetical protein